ncbi:MAG: GNAT family N-acetyltransferase [Azospirillum sp.]|nr:GNAT family N-acetyltransferase [Azospirillum sp.]
MTIRNLDRLFKPKSVTIIGASRQTSSVGAVLARNLFRAGFAGPVMPVNPRHESVEGVLCYRDVASLPLTPDLAVIAIPCDGIPAVIDELGARGTKAAIVLTTGDTVRSAGAAEAQRKNILEAARPHGLRVVGPDSLGVMVPGTHLNASAAHLTPAPGRLAFVAQSGAVVSAVLDWAAPRGIGFSHLVSLGDMADVDFGAVLDYLANDGGTRGILLYIEAVTNARRFMSAARAAARSKPVIVVKAGRNVEAARAVASHTGALAGADAVYDAVFRRAGMLRVQGLEELFDAVEILGLAHVPANDRLAIVTNSGGIGVLATDALIDEGGRLAELAPETIARLDRALGSTWSHANPVDLLSVADGKRYVEALAAISDDPGVDAVLALNCPVSIASGVEAAQAIAAAKRKDRPALLTSWVGAATTLPARRLFVDRRIPTYDTPAHAVQAFLYLVNYRRNQIMLMETPPSVPETFSPDIDRVRETIDQALADGRDWLNEAEAKDILAAYAIPVVPTRMATTADQAAWLAAEIGGPVVVKIISPDIPHKTDVGGVALDVVGPAAAKHAAAAMIERVRSQRPDARIAGVTVQPMIQRPGAFELIVGTVIDPQFGPVILFGHGGTAVEVVNDKALGLPPLTMHLARELMTRTRIFKLLEGYRELPSANLEAIALTIIKVSQLVTDVPEILDLDINPLLADEYGVVALDARMRIGPATSTGPERLAIRPYPKELEERIRLGDGRELLLRPVVPEDEPSLQAAIAQLSPEEMRLRFFAPMKTMSHVMAARFTQLDYDREMALILTEPGIPGTKKMYGVVSLNADASNESGEYAILVRGDMTGMGLGLLLMRRIIDYAKSRAIGEIYGDVLLENHTMLRLCRALGFVQSQVPDEPDQLRVTLKLPTPAPVVGP